MMCPFLAGYMLGQIDLLVGARQVTGVEIYYNNMNAM